MRSDHAAPYLAQINNRRFAFEPHLIMTTLAQVAATGLSIIFVETISQGLAVAKYCDSVNMPIVDYHGHVSIQSLLRHWQRITTMCVSGVLILPQLPTCMVGWYAYADRILWVGDEQDRDTPEYQQASLRIRGKTFPPIIIDRNSL